MTGFERNADIVFAASYAPLLQVRIMTYDYITHVTDVLYVQHVNSTQWVSNHKLCCLVIELTLALRLLTLSASSTYDILLLPTIHFLIMSHSSGTVYRSTSYYVQKVSGTLKYLVPIVEPVPALQLEQRR